MDTANTLSRLLHETLVYARLSPFSIYLAIDVFTNKTYSRLPNCIKSHFLKNNEITKIEESLAYQDLNRLILYRLSSSKLPKQFKKINLKNGRVKFTVPNEFSITLSLMSDSPSFPWRILKIEFLVQDEINGISGDIIHPVQVNFILKHMQQRILYRNIDPTPPLFNIYKSLHAFTMSLQLDLLHEQAQKAKRMRPMGQIFIEEYVLMKRLKVSYWRNLAQSNFHSSMSAEGKLYTQVYSVTIKVDEVDPDRPLTVVHHPPLSLDDCYKIGVTVDSSSISFERILFKTMTLRAEAIMREIRRELLFLSPGPINRGQIPLAIYVPILWPCTQDEMIFIKMHPTQGTLHVSFTGLSVSSQSSILTSDQSLQNIIHTQLSIIEIALNRPTSRRTIGESSNVSSLLQRNLRMMSVDDAKFRQTIIGAIAKLSQLIALQRLYHSTIMGRGQILPVNRHLPIIFPEIISNKSEFLQVIEAIQNDEKFGLFIKLFPSNDYYILIVINTDKDHKRILFSQYLVICLPIISAIDCKLSNDGKNFLVASSIPSINRMQNNFPSGNQNKNSVFLRVSHFIKIDSSKDFTLDSQSIKSLEFNQVNKIGSLLNQENSELCELTEYPDIIHQRTIRQIMIPSFNLLLDKITESIWVSHFQEELNKSAMKFKLIEKDQFGLPNVIQINQFSPKYVPYWLKNRSSKLLRYISSIHLFTSFNHTSQNKSFTIQLKFIFEKFSKYSKDNLPGLGKDSKFPMKKHDNQITYRWSLNKLDDFPDLIKNCIHVEWYNLVALFTLCEPILFQNKSLHQNVQLVNYNLKSLVLVYGINKEYSVEITHTIHRNFALSFSQNFSAMLDNKRKDRISNPYQHFKPFFEEILNSVKNIQIFSNVLMQSFPFYEPLGDISSQNLNLLTYFNLSDVCNPRPVRDIIIVTQSCFDVLLVYCQCLSLEFQLVINGPESLVRISDGFPLLSLNSTKIMAQMIGKNNATIGNAMPLPAFKYFMTTLEEFYQEDPEAIKKDDESYLVKMEIFKKLLNRPLINQDKKSRFNTKKVQPSIIEYYLSMSLQFHATYTSIKCLKGQLETQEAQIQNQPVSLSSNLCYAPQNISARGELISRWFNAGLQLKIQMTPLHEALMDNDLPINKIILGSLRLKLQTLVSPAPNQVILWSQNDGLEIIEEFFALRVVRYDNMLTAIRSFHQLLLLPTKVLQQVVRILAWDLNPPKFYDLNTPLNEIFTTKFTDPNQAIQTMDTNQASCGLKIRVGLTGITTSSTAYPSVPTYCSIPQDFQPNLLGIFVRQPLLFLHLIIFNNNPNSAPSNVLGQSVCVVYDWEKNQVSIVLPNLHVDVNNPQVQPKHILLAQNLKTNEVDLMATKQANMQNKCALLHFIVLIGMRLTNQQNPDSHQSIPSQSSVNSASTPNPGSVPPFPQPQAQYHQQVQQGAQPCGNMQIQNQQLTPNINNNSCTPQHQMAASSQNMQHSQPSPYSQSIPSNQGPASVGSLNPQSQQSQPYPLSNPSIPGSFGQPNTPL